MTPIQFPGLGIEVTINPVAFSIFGKDVYWYGIIIACGFLMAVAFCSRQSPKLGIKQDDILDMLFFAVPMALVGARLYYVIFYQDLYRDANGAFQWSKAIAIWDGGIAIYGGIIASVLTGAVFCKVKKISFWAMADTASYGFLIGQLVGRWGNFVNQEAYGGPCTALWRMGLTKGGSYIEVHPTFLYESLRPVPVLSFTIRHLNCIAGIVITASHNPKQYNGYKAYWTDGGQMPPESVKGITDRLPETTYAESLPMDEQEALDKGLLVYIGKEVDDAYIAAVKKLAVNPELAREMGKTLKIVYTPLHGSGNIPVRRIFDEIGMKNVYVVKEQELPDGNFPTVKVPNPEDPAAFTLALKMQQELGADLCVGTDPDCDRVGIACMTKDGVRLLNGNQIGCVLLHYILSQKAERGELPANAAAVKSIVSTEMARAICKDFGVELIEVLTGFKYIAEQIHLFETTGSHTFMFGFEESYGFLSGTHARDKDGVNACMLIAEAASYYKTKGKTLVDGIDELYEKYGYYGDKVVSVTLPGKDGLAKIQTVMANLRANPPKAFAGTAVAALRDYQAGTRVLADGSCEALTLPKSNVLYFELADGGWICVRPSGTEPKIKLYVNAVSGNAEKTQELLAAYAQAAEDAMDAAGK